MLFPRLLLIFLSLFFCVSCGLKPVYSNKHSSQINSQLGAIDIEPITSIAGAECYYYLASILPRTTKVPAKYLLKIIFISTFSPGTIQKNSDILREAISQSVSYQLLDISTHKEITSGHFNNITSSDSFSTPYGSEIESQKTLEDFTRHAADEVRERLILYFRQNAI
jgi:hypothetical protein